MSYSINTFVNNLAQVSLFDDIYTVAILVHSKSNYIPKGMPVAINDTTSLAVYFPDCIDKDNEELQLINTLLGQGYRIIAINIADTSNKETLLITENGTNKSHESYWYDPKLNLGYLGTVLHDKENLAIKIDLKAISHDVGSQFYFLLEHRVGGLLYPVLIMNQEVPTDLANHWNVVHAHDLEIDLDWEILGKDSHGEIIYGSLTDETAEILAKAMMDALSREQYTCVYDAQEKCVYAAFSYPFVDFTTLSNIAIDWAPVFNDIYLPTAVQPNKYLLGIESIYNSDLADIEVDIYKKRNIYCVDVIKTYADSVCNTIESYEGLDVTELVSRINDLSNHVILTNYRADSLPLGKFFLRQQNTHATYGLDNYYAGLESLRSLIYEEDFAYYFNLFYEPDIRYLVEGEQKKLEEQLKIQSTIKNIFDITALANLPIVKLMSYLGETIPGYDIGTQYYSYFVDRCFEYNGEKVSGKALYLLLLTSNLLESNLGPELVLTQDLPEELPFYVNNIQKNYRNYSTFTLKTVYGEKVFDIKDILMIACVNILLYSILGDVTPSRVSDQLNIIQQYYLKYFDYLPSINIAKYKQDGNILYLSVEYTTDNLQEVNTVDLVLNLS